MRVVKEMPLPLVAKHLNLNELYRLSWGAKNAHGSEWKRLQVEFDLRREAMLRSAEKEGWLKPQGVYGYWPVLADDDTLVVYDPQTLTEKQPSELERFEFPRQVGGEDLCLADYFLPVGSGRFDVVAFQIVTVGDPLANVSRSLKPSMTIPRHTLRTAWRCRWLKPRRTFCTRISAGNSG